ncbi:MAG: Obg family GTPase CgtA [Coxiellaceae bacterium]|jgi:GTP-binding protein|nr:Obg family GTPase CgtA [Coxiellaceae bacterium]
MKFIDEATIKVKAGTGGDGCLSFRREKFAPFGGPNGGNGGNGGNIFFVTDSNLNTLVDFRFCKIFNAEHGKNGGGSQCSGKNGKDLMIKVPVGTLIYDNDTNELIIDLNQPNQKFCIAKGGFHGFGNLYFKSSTNRTPRKITKGKPGEERNLTLELKLLADVGLLGLPNAGKSTFIRAVSAARPKIADYPFTTLYPNLGIVRLDKHKSFVIADIPGLISGATNGIGLGIKFLKHLTRTSVLLHLIDIAPLDGSDPVEAANIVIAEIKKFNRELAKKERWIVLNKIDLLPKTELQDRVKNICNRLKWKGKIFQVSAIKKIGTQEVCYQLMEYFENIY